MASALDEAIFGKAKGGGPRKVNVGHSVRFWAMFEAVLVGL